MNNYKTKLYTHRWIARQDAVFSKTLLECLTTVSLIGKKKVNHVCLLVLKIRQVSQVVQEKQLTESNQSNKYESPGLARSLPAYGSQ